MAQVAHFSHYATIFIKNMKYQDYFCFPKDLFTQRGTIKAPTKR